MLGILEKLCGENTDLWPKLRSFRKCAIRDQQKYFNKSGQAAALAIKNFQVQALARKLASAYIKVNILEGINKNAYRVELPKKYRRLYDVFHVSLLES